MGRKAGAGDSDPRPCRQTADRRPAWRALGKARRGLSRARTPLWRRAPSRCVWPQAPRPLDGVGQRHRARGVSISTIFSAVTLCDRVLKLKNHTVFGDPGHPVLITEIELRYTSEL